MTPEERIAAHEQWLLDHDRAIAEMQEIQRETVAIQRKQSAVLLEIAEHVARLLDRDKADVQAADEQRLRDAAERSGVLYVGCDTPDALAETILALKQQLKEAGASALLNDMAQYLKDGETPAECVARNRADVDAVLTTLAREQHRSKLLYTALHTVMQHAPGYDWNADSERLTLLIGEAYQAYEQYFPLQSGASALLKEEQKVHHFKDGDSTRCGAPQERGNSYYEWAYVDCPACLATRAQPSATVAEARDRMITQAFVAGQMDPQLKHADELTRPALALLKERTYRLAIESADALIAAVRTDALATREEMGKMLTHCRKCGEFRGHGHECKPLPAPPAPEDTPRE